MQETADILKILTEVAPLALSTLILSAVLLFLMWGSIKIIIPAMRESVQMSETQRLAWKSILDEQNRIHKLMVDDVQRDLAEERGERLKLDARLKEMEAELARKDVRIAELQKEINTLRQALADKDVLIRDLRSELDRVKDDRKKVEKERDDLLHRIEALELAQRADKPTLITPEATSDPNPTASH